MCRLAFHLSLSFYFAGGFRSLSRVSVLFIYFYVCLFLFLFFVSTKLTKTITTNKQTRSLVDRGGGIWDFQHCIVITRGQEERIPKTASVVGTNFGLRSFSL